MYRIKSLFFIMLFFTTVIFTACSKKDAKVNDNTAIEVDYGTYFNGMEGTAVIYSEDQKTYYIYNKELAKKQSSPCSTFKVISCLMGLESGVIQPDNSIIKWNGVQYPVKEWNEDLDYKRAFQNTCIWYYRTVIDQIGKEYVEKTLDDLEYGNQDISQWEGTGNNLIFPDLKDQPEINGFWQESSLLISPIEQVDVLRRIFEQRKGFKEENINLLKEAMHIDIDDIQLFGKTGSGIKDNNWNDGWFIGVKDIEDDSIYFAVRLNQNGKRGNDAKEVAIKILNEEFK